MPAKPPYIAKNIADQLSALGQQIRARRKALGINATATAESAGMSRVTLHRIEKGEPAVTMGAYANVMAVLGLDFGLVNAAAFTEPDLASVHEGWIPARIRLADYAQLRQLAWQVQGVDAISPVEAWDIYERNWRHLDEQLMTDHERQLVDALRLAFGGANSNV